MDINIDTNELSNILNKFSSYDPLTKVKIIRFLYQHAYINMADDLLDTYKSEILEHRVAKSMLDELIKNKKLYIYKANHKVD